jgi:hypothetical protein
MWYAFWCIVGILIGWHVPQPDWAKNAITWVKSKVKR